jgi:Flp pilus assembly protein TadD
MIRAAVRVLALLAGLSAWAQTATNRLERGADRLAGPTDPDWLDDLRITLPGQSGRGTPRPSAAPIFIPPELAVQIETNPAPAAPEFDLIHPAYSPAVNRHLSRALTLLASNQVFQATRELWQAARQAPDLPEPASGLALAYLLAEDNDRAARLLEKLVVRQPGDPDLRFNLASAWYGQGRHAEALRLLQSLTEQAAFADKVHYNLGLNLLALGETGDALRAFRRAAEIDPRNPAPLLAMARLHARRREVEPTLALLRLAAPLLPTRERERLAEDPAFAPLAEQAAFRAALQAP